MLHDDRHNAALIAYVHPPDWANPTPEGRYNLVVIGGGTAGLICALGAAGLGAKVALVERQYLGGDCLNFGCVPSKALLAAAKRAKASGKAGPEAFTAAMDEVRRLRAEIGAHDSAKRLTEAGIDVFFGDACFVDSKTLIVEGTPLRFRRAVVATGARAAVPPIPGLAESTFLTNESIFELTELPTRLSILGAGAIGCELAQAFTRLGSIVTLFDMDPRPLPHEPPEVSRIIAEQLKSEGVTMEMSASVVRVEGTTLVLGDGREPGADAVLVATGRTPNIDGLGLTAAGVSFDGRTGLVVDDRLRTTNRRIYAAGDVASHHKFTHAADAMARIVLRNALFGGRSKVSALAMSWCTYTSPEVAHVGLTAAEAAERGDRVLLLRQDLSSVDRAIVDGTPEGFAWACVDAKSGRVLGATMVAPHAGEAISEMAVVVTNKLSISAVSNTIHPYPTVASVWKGLGDQFQKTKFKPWIARLFERIFRFAR